MTGFFCFFGVDLAMINPDKLVRSVYGNDVILILPQNYRLVFFVVRQPLRVELFY